MELNEAIAKGFKRYFEMLKEVLDPPTEEDAFTLEIHPPMGDVRISKNANQTTHEETLSEELEADTEA